MESMVIANQKSVALDSDRERAIEKLYREHGAYIQSLLYALLGPPLRAEAADLAQEVFLLALRKYDTFNGDAPRGWLCTLAAHLALNARRRFWFRRKARLVSLRTAEDYTLTPERLTSERQELAHLEACLEQLPERRRLAFILIELKGFPPGEAALALGCSIRQIYKLHFHARRTLIERFKERESTSTQRPRGNDESQE